MAKKQYYDTEQYGSLTLKNGGGCILESDTNGSLCTKIAGKQVKFLTQNNYVIGDIYLTTSTDSPAVRYGGSWEKLTHDAYLKIVSSGAGNLGGSETHSHSSGTMIAAISAVDVGGGYLDYKLVNSVDWTATNRSATSLLSTNATPHPDGAQVLGNTSSESNKPPYYGIYAWIKRAM